jgi:hypothetical protein
MVAREPPIVLGGSGRGLCGREFGSIFSTPYTIAWHLKQLVPDPDVPCHLRFLFRHGSGDDDCRSWPTAGNPFDTRIRAESMFVLVLLRF